VDDPLPEADGAWTLRRAGFVSEDGVRVTNFTPDPSAPSSVAPAMGWLRGFPRGGVALQLWFGEGDPVGPPPLRDSEFPLSPASFRRIRPYVGGREPSPDYRSFFADGFDLNAAIWFGPAATRADRQPLWRVVRSLRFPALRAGTVWQQRYYVLGLASRYSTGSVTSFPAVSLPHGLGKREGFYLIHAPRAFYVIDQTFQRSLNPANTCPVRLDRQRFHFFCPGTRLRWDRLGRPLWPHAGSGAYPALETKVATVAQDGHVLFCSFFGGLLGLDLEGNPWA
jgi:hypothetical protein